MPFCMCSVETNFRNSNYTISDGFVVPALNQVPKLRMPGLNIETECQTFPRV